MLCLIREFDSVERHQVVSPTTGVYGHGSDTAVVVVAAAAVVVVVMAVAVVVVMMVVVCVRGSKSVDGLQSSMHPTLTCCSASPITASSSTKIGSTTRL